jgi:hypothetical protein
VVSHLHAIQLAGWIIVLFVLVWSANVSNLMGRENQHTCPACGGKRKHTKDCLWRNDEK